MANWRYYGWRIVAVAFIADFVGVGFFFYSYGVFFKSLANEFNSSRFGMSLGLPLANLVGAMIAPFLGQLLDRYSIRRVMIAGAILTSMGFAASSFITSLWQYYLVVGSFIAIGTSAMGNMASATLVANWFIQRRGTALGIATVGISLSGLVMPPLATWLIEIVGWRASFQIYAVATALIVIAPVAMLVFNSPEDIGLHPDAASGPSEEEDTSSLDHSVTQRGLLRDSRFWLLSITFGIGIGCLSAILTHLVPALTDQGFSAYWAATALSIAASCGIAGKFLFGWLVDRLDPRIALWSCFGLQLIGVLLLTKPTTQIVQLGAAGIFGLGMGGVIPLQGSLIGIVFGRHAFGRAMGLLRPVQTPLAAMGVPLAGWLFDQQGNYQVAFLIFAAAYLCGMILITRLKLPKPESTPIP